jgi:MscS family membrane protein
MRQQERGGAELGWGHGWIAQALRVVVTLALVIAAIPASARAAPPEGEADAGAADTGAADAGVAEDVASDSPRASVASYLELCRAGSFTEAARYLDAPSGADGPLLAEHLKAVLDNNGWLALDELSSLSWGNPADALPPGTDELTTIPGPGGAREPVRIVRHEEQGEARWVFSRATVRRIDGWYARLDHRWVLDHLPSGLLRPGPRELLLWQWVALPILLLLAWIVGSVLSTITRAILGLFASRTAWTWDEAILERLKRPIVAGWAIALLYGALPWLGLYAPAEAFLLRALHSAALVVLFWALLRAVRVATQIVGSSEWAKAHPASRALVPLGARTANVLLLAVAIVAVLSDLGYPVASLIAGLGVGGLAVALAAQKTVENLFGAFSIGFDQPFREGDFVKIEDFVGTVEAIGLRSTRVRTLDRTLISIPNGKLAEMRLESYAARDRIRLSCTLGLVYATTAAQMRQVLEGLEAALRAHPKIWPDVVVVRFESFAASSLDIAIMAWFTTSDWAEFQLIRQGVLLEFMEVVEKAGSSFAFPTRTVHLVNEPVASIPAGAPPR